MNDLSLIGHNNPPVDPIDAINASHEDNRMEAENWLDGSSVENEAQMAAVDKLRKSIRDWRIELESGQKSATAPLHDIYKAELSRWKPTIDDVKRIEAGLVAAVDGFKRKLAAEKEAARKKAEADAWEATRKAQEAARLADASNIEAQRQAADAQAQAEAAQRAAMAAKNDTVKGMRTVTRYQIEDHRAALHWIAANDRDAMTAFIEEYTRRNHKDKQIAGVKVWQEKEAY